MVISWTPSGAVVTVPTPGPGVGVAAGAAGARPTHPLNEPTATIVPTPQTANRRILRPVIAGAPYASEGRQAADRRQSARPCRTRRPRPASRAPRRPAHRGPAA